MDNEAPAAHKMVELTERTKLFLSKFDDDDINNLVDAIQSYATVRTMRCVVKWTAITVLAAIVGIVSLYEGRLIFLAGFICGIHVKPSALKRSFNIGRTCPLYVMQSV